MVKNLNISVKWSGQEQAPLDESGGFLGPFSLAGAPPPTSASDGSWTYTRPGMEVVALMCSRLPVLPPANAPDVVGTTPQRAHKPHQRIQSQPRPTLRGAQQAPLEEPHERQPLAGWHKRPPQTIDPTDKPAKSTPAPATAAAGPSSASGDTAPPQQ